MTIKLMPCQCGCGESKMGTERMMFLNEACKARARRARVKAAKLDKQKGEAND